MMLLDHAAYTNALRRVHPAEKAGFAALCLIASLLARHPAVPLAVGALVTLAAVGLARLPFRTWMTVCLLPVGFLVAGGLSLALDQGFRVTDASLSRAVLVTVRSLGCSMALLFLAATTPFTHLVLLLRRARVPALALDLLTISYRAIVLLLDTADQMRRAQASRLGYSGLGASLRSMGMLSGNLLGRSLLRGNLSWQAMLSRGYDQELRVLPEEFQVSVPRLVAGFALGLGLVILAILLPGSGG